MSNLILYHVGNPVSLYHLLKNLSFQYAHLESVFNIRLLSLCFLMFGAYFFLLVSFELFKLLDEVYVNFQKKIFVLGFIWIVLVEIFYWFAKFGEKYYLNFILFVFL